VIQRAIMHVQSTSNGRRKSPRNVLVAIFGEGSHAVYYLHQQGVTRLDVVNFIAHGIKKAIAEAAKAATTRRRSRRTGTRRTRSRLRSSSTRRT
jgi:ATP-dependent Clp protease ATP-binding subunit ClpA